jgi:hypothetical protein
MVRAYWTCASPLPISHGQHTWVRSNAAEDADIHILSIRRRGHSVSWERNLKLTQSRSNILNMAVFHRPERKYTPLAYLYHIHVLRSFIPSISHRDLTIL